MKKPKVWWDAFVFMVCVLCISGHVNAQHCRWDATGIVVFEIKANASDTFGIDSLRISIVDSSGNPIYYPYFYDGKEIKKQLIIFQNEPDAGCNTHKMPRTTDVRCFWFARKNYVAIGSFHVFLLPGNQLIIEDIDGIRNGGEFKKCLVSPDTSCIFPLCHRNSTWEENVGKAFVEDYKPMRIVMMKRESE